MSIAVPVLELLDHADRLRAAAVPAWDAAARLQPVGPAGDIAAALGDTLEVFALAARGLATEAEQLGDDIDAAARSWLALDAHLLPRRGQVLAR